MNAPTQTTPWHLWVIGVVTLLWNAMGALDFVMTQTQNEGYMEAFTEEQLEFFYGLPSWVVFAWGTAVFGSVIGSALLLLRSRWALQVFAISLVAMLLTTIQNFLLSNGLEIMGTVGVIFSAIIFTIAVGLVWYAWAMKRAGVLS